MRSIAVAAAAVVFSTGLAGCGTIAGSTDQMVLVQTIFDNRELHGAGCVISNDMGKWFVTTPGRIIIRKSEAPLIVDCKKPGAAPVVASEAIDSRVNGSLWGNVILTMGVGYIVDRNTGAAFDYPSTLTIVMQDPARKPAPVMPAPALVSSPAPAAAMPQAVVQPQLAPSPSSAPAPLPAPVLKPSPIPEPVVY